MAKVALLIGASEYGEGLSPLPGATKDVEAMQRVLQHSAMGSFDEVKTLLNTDPQVMQEAIETLFSGRAKEDLVLLFFSGHGIKDESGRLYLATHITRKNTQRELVKATAVPASFVQDIMSNSRSKRQVVILDCCFSGAFAEGWLAKDDGSVDVKNQLGGEGRAVLTSSTSTQYSFEQQGIDLSVYTHYLVEGIETGAADQTNDGVISVDELHEYAKKKVQEAAPAMKPEIYAVREGFKIWLSKAPTDDPKLRYRQEVELYASRGEISMIGRNALDALRQTLGLSPEETAAIEAEVLKPYQEYKQKLQQYEQALVDAMRQERTLSDNTRHELQRYQQILGLRNEDIAPIEARISPQKKSVLVPVLAKPKLLIGTGIVTTAALAFYFLVTLQLTSEPKLPESPTPTPSSTQSSPGLPSPKNIDDADVYNSRGLASFAFRKYKEAINDYNQAIRINPNFSLAYYNRGDAYFALGEKQKAIKDYITAIEVNSTWGNKSAADAYKQKASVYSALGNKQAAIVDYQEAAKRYHKKGKIKESQDILNKVKKLQQ
ncbi:MAG: caspase family protein [Iphinoe sp. HA4291-MV1]|jgi:tetratricopeptide (TPR) repeat protein|nr:caspase family protein [Iphinoe sp. HA4291-MV1]